MKTPSIIVGLLVALVLGILLQVVRTAEPEVSNSMLGIVAIAIIAIVRVKYIRSTKRDEQLVANGLNHYRHHIHHRKLIKKTS